ncbi:MAG: PHP domain-containing protein, partial [Oscillospiraceae bacterium]
MHTRWSDGSMPVEEVVAVAACAGLAGLAITDHDSMAMIPTAQQVAQRCGIELIPGVELSTIDHETGRKVHILVYFPQDDKPLIP